MTLNSTVMLFGLLCQLPDDSTATDGSSKSWDGKPTDNFQGGRVHRLVLRYGCGSKTKQESPYLHIHHISEQVC